VGQQVLVLIPDTTASKLFSKWRGPATVVAVRSPYSYEVNLDGNVRHYHANHLRKYHVRVESVLYDSSVYQFNVDDECLNADDVDVNACAVVYTSDREFGELEPIPTSLTSPSCHDLPSTKIDPDTIKHLTKSQQSELFDLLDCYNECFAVVPRYPNVVNHSSKPTLKEGFRPKLLPANRITERLKPMKPIVCMFVYVALLLICTGYCCLCVLRP